ncbi:hypothetical protein [Streptomyces sp. SAJ15]|uniref:hypothetical protein n=1 Tax=Streptomyces sp. SAJ15 TaxID=2011095 RepID=UPI0011857305|nr:hypothetical protein [Streptomyces sp. SAJ15]TVL89733.1 hypothetical protein CD790_25370 [Streptomyces sp. SAJ15]
MSSRITPADLADAIRFQAVAAGASTPTVRGADWQTATVTAVGAGTVDCGTVTARRMDSYQNPAIGDRIVLTQSGNGNWAALGRLSGSAEAAFSTFTPTWTVTSGTNPTLGNGTLSGRYWRHGSNVVGTINLTIGSTTSLGSGNYFWQLPTSVAGLIAVCPAQILTSSQRWAGQGIVSSTDTNRIGVYMPSAAGNGELIRVSATKASPNGAFASGDQVRVTFQYEAA